MRKSSTGAIALLVGGIVCLSLLAVEGLSGLVLLAHYRLTHKPFPAELRFHPAFQRADAPAAFTGKSLYAYDPILGYRYRPNSPDESQKICGQGFIDNYGCTPETPDLAHKAPGTTRIFLLGGSTVAGSSGNAFTIAAYLERGLKARDPGRRYEVINFGVGGYTSVQELILFENDVLRYHPDVVIFYDGVNDVFEGADLGGYMSEYERNFAPMNFHEYYAYLTQQIAEERGYGLRVDAALLARKFYTTALLFKLRNWALGRFVTARSRAAVEHRIVNSPAEAASLYLQNMENAIAVAAYHDIPIAYFLEPTLWNKPVRASGEGDRADARERGDERAVLEFQAAAVAGIRRIEGAPNAGGRTRARVKALLDIFEGVSQRAFIDSSHTNNWGNEVIAKRLLLEIAPLLNR